MSDPRILPDTTLDTYRADIKRANDNDLGHVWLWRAQELLAHIDATSGGRAEAKAEALREAAKEIAAQESCASPAGECYRDHYGCFVAESLRIVRDRADRIEKEQGQ